MASDRPTPASDDGRGNPLGDRLSRGRNLARFSAGAGAGLLGARLRDLTGQGGAETAFHAETAAQAAELLGSMKGLAMKMGQIASFVDVDLPPEVRAAYQQELAALRAQSEPVGVEVIEGVIAEQYGTPAEDVFAVWDPEPVASASIGQVHRATLPDGSDVAVKVQYPGIAEAIESDLDNAELLAPLVKVVSPNLKVKPLMLELRDRMSDELDYQREAQYHQAFFDRYDGHPFVRIPAVHLEWCRPRILVTEFVEGQSFEGMLAEADDAAKQRYAEAIYRFSFGSLHRFRLFNGDPHPGNYLFPGDGSVVFLDFGAVKTFTSQMRAMIKRQLAPLWEDDAEGLLAVFDEAGFLPGAKPDAQRLLDWFKAFNAPILSYEPFTYTQTFAQSVIAMTSDPRAGYSDMIRRLNLPPDYLVLNRIQWGINSIMALLGATNTWRRISEEFWFDAPPATPMGEEERPFIDASNLRA
ncbi:ABC1 kinase family protein [Euzebya tangerina]|uniref:ABC1 kinase family protein n=1 Tax=Euzebya tangerina TaxID=591198 RepID=UPI000E30D140|nr:AarF/ABC1/UbiB kinase family protein [Euzebya tangerina]